MKNMLYFCTKLTNTTFYLLFIYYIYIFNNIIVFRITGKSKQLSIEFFIDWNVTGNCLLL